MKNAQSLFALALGLAEPWYVAKVEFSPEKRRLDLFLDFHRGSLFVCPQCGKPGAKPHDTRVKDWRHLNFFQHTCYLRARVPRVECPQGCGVHLVEVPWARPESGFTLLFEAFVLALAAQMPVKAIAELVGEHDTLLRRILRHYVDKARASADFGFVTEVGVDKTAAKRGHDYVTFFMDLQDRRLLFATPGKGKATLATFVQDLRAHQGDPERIVRACCDLSPAFTAGIAEHLPQAELTYDRFHLMQIVNRAVDEVRRQEVRVNALLKGTRYLWLKNPDQLTDDQAAQLQSLTRRHLKTARAYHIRLAFQDFFEQPDRQTGEAYLARWYAWAIRSRLQPIQEAARTIKRHWNGVLAWLDSRISNGLLEGTCSLIQAAKSKARGYRSHRNLITVAYIVAGKLNYGLPT